MEEPSTWWCYCIESSPPGQRRRTYIGSTNNLLRRIRQHRREISGGARATGGRDDWRFLWYLGCPAWTHLEALSAEWHLKHPKSKIRCRVSALCEWIEKSPEFPTPFCVYISPQAQSLWSETSTCLTKPCAAIAADTKLAEKFL